MVSNKGWIKMNKEEFKEKIARNWDAFGAIGALPESEVEEWMYTNDDGVKVTPKALINKTFEHYRKTDFIEERNGIEVINGGYALLFSLNDRVFVVSQGNIIQHQGTLYELTQAAVGKYMAFDRSKGHCANETVCVSSHGPAMGFMNICKPVPEAEAKSVLEVIADGYDRTQWPIFRKMDEKEE